MAVGLMLVLVVLGGYPIATSLADANKTITDLREQVSDSNEYIRDLLEILSQLEGELQTMEQLCQRRYGGDGAIAISHGDVRTTCGPALPGSWLVGPDTGQPAIPHQSATGRDRSHLSSLLRVCIDSGETDGT